MQNKLSKEEWVSIFRDIGLDDKTMNRWHQLFEERHPDAHNEFLKWLGISPDEIEHIRRASR